MGTDALILDTGPVVAFTDRDDRHHEACAELIAGHDGPLLVPQLCVSEVSHVLRSRIGPGSDVGILFDLATGAFLAAPAEPADWARIADLVATYRSLGLDATDASVVALAERLGVVRIATLDRRHFAAVRPAHVDAFELVP